MWYGDFEALERVSSEERVRYLEGKLRHIVAFAYRNAPAVRRKLDGAGVRPEDIRTIADLEKVPITRKEDILALQKESPPFGGLCTRPIEELERVFISPGPIFEPLPWTVGAGLALKAAGFGKGDVALLTPSFHMVPAGALYAEGLKLVGATVVPSGPGNTELQIQIMKHLGVNAYVGFPRFLLNIIQRAEAMGYNFRRDFNLRKAFLGGEMFPPSMRRTMEEGYGIDTWEHYGTADLGVVAYECPQKAGLHIFQGVIVEIVDPATGSQLRPGEAGEIVVTTFNETYPLIRYGTGDAAFYTEEPCPCGRTSPRLVDILGRVGDAPRVRGLFLVPKEVLDVVTAFPEVSACQAFVRLVGLRDEITLRVEAEPADPQGLEQALKKRFKEVCRLDLDRVEFVPRGAIPQGAKVIVDERKWE